MYVVYCYKAAQHLLLYNILAKDLNQMWHAPCYQLQYVLKKKSKKRGKEYQQLVIIISSSRSSSLQVLLLTTSSSSSSSLRSFFFFLLTVTGRGHVYVIASAPQGLLSTSISLSFELAIMEFQCMVIYISHNGILSTKLQKKNNSFLSSYCY